MHKLFLKVSHLRRKHQREFSHSLDTKAMAVVNVTARKVERERGGEKEKQNIKLDEWQLATFPPVNTYERSSIEEKEVLSDLCFNLFFCTLSIFTSFLPSGPTLSHRARRLRDLFLVTLFGINFLYSLRTSRKKNSKNTYT